MKIQNVETVVNQICDKATAQICASALNKAVQGQTPKIVYAILVGQKACDGELSIVKMEVEQADQSPG